MTLKYKIIKDKRTVYVIGEGEITFSELMDHIDELAHDQDYMAPMKKLIDYRNINSLNLTISESDSFANKKAEHKDVFLGEKCALVTPADSSFGTARVHDTLIGLKEPNIETRVFRDIMKAQEWLGIELADDELIIG